MKNNIRGFSLVELLITIPFVLIVGFVLYSVVIGLVNGNSNAPINPYLFPRQAQAQAAQEQAEAYNRLAAALEEQNRRAQNQTNNPSK